MRRARGEGRWVVGGWRPAAALLVLLAPHPSPLAAQAPGTYVEHAVITVTAGDGTVGSERMIVRDGHYDVSRRGDTVVVQATALELRSSHGAETIRHDTDGFVGGRWKLVAAPDGGWRVADEPFVPVALGELLDLAGMMADFFPATPPAGLPVGTITTDADGRTWERLPGDGRHAVHGWTLRREVDSTRALSDAMDAVVHERLAERGEGRWTADGPVAWTRTLTIDSETVVAGRVVRAVVRQEVEVHRQS